MTMEPNASPKTVYTVSELTERIKFRLEQAFSNLWVHGEVGSLSRPASGHLYFTIKDKQSQLRCVMFRHLASLNRFDLQQGLQILLWGHLNVFAPRGEYQLIVDQMEPYGLGSLYLAFEQLKEKLATEGLFDQERKRPLPFLPRRIGLVTSPSGAVLHDMINIMTRRNPHIQILLSPAQMQGEISAASIVSALKNLFDYGGVDLIILARGGGSVEDLWSLNEESVARTIVASPFPVISAIGHETDFTIADFAADLRAATPSAAAELTVPEFKMLHSKITDARRRLAQGITYRLQHAFSRLADLSARQPNISQRLDTLRLSLDDLTMRLLQNTQRSQEKAAARLEHLKWMLSAVSPHKNIADRIQRMTRLQERLTEAMKRYQTEKTHQLKEARLRLVAGDISKIAAQGFVRLHKLPEGDPVASAKKIKPADEVRIDFVDGEATANIAKVIN